MQTPYKANRMVQWNEEANRSFDRVRENIRDATMLYFPRDDQELILETDASDYAIGAALYQYQGTEKKPIRFLSKTLDKTQRNWYTPEKEAFAIYYALHNCRTY